MSFANYLAQVAASGKVINTLFEEQLFNLAGILQRVSDALTQDQIPHEVIGGLAVSIHIEAVNPEHTTTTRDVDLMISRSDLERVKHAAAKHGFRFRHMDGIDMLLYGETVSAVNAVRLVFSGEKVRPERMLVQGKEVLIIPVADLIRMKLSAYRLKDQVHIQAMDAAGLITPAIDDQLIEELRLRLKHIRETE